VPDVRWPVGISATLSIIVVSACLAGPQILEVETAPDSHDPVGPYRISATVSQPSGVRDLSIRWTSHEPQSDGGTVASADQRTRMTQETEGFFEGALPGHPAGTRIEYRLQLTDQLGVTTFEPRAPGTFQFHVLPADGGMP